VTSPAPTKQKNQTVRLSAYDIVIDVGNPTSPTNDILMTPLTSNDDEWPGLNLSFTFSPSPQCSAYRVTRL
jgi:hypothetical protein